MTAACRRCAHYVPDEPPRGPLPARFAAGTCHALPPVYVPGTNRPGWPSVAASDRCGAFAATDLPS